MEGMSQARGLKPVWSSLSDVPWPRVLPFLLRGIHVGILAAALHSGVVLSYDLVFLLPVACMANGFFIALAKRVEAATRRDVLTVSFFGCWSHVLPRCGVLLSSQLKSACPQTFCWHAVNKNSVFGREFLCSSLSTCFCLT